MAITPKSDRGASCHMQCASVRRKTRASMGRATYFSARAGFPHGFCELTLLILPRTGSSELHFHVWTVLEEIWSAAPPTAWDTSRRKRWVPIFADRASMWIASWHSFVQCYRISHVTHARASSMRTTKAAGRLVAPLCLQGAFNKPRALFWGAEQSIQHWTEQHSGTSTPRFLQRRHRQKMSRGVPGDVNFKIWIWILNATNTFSWISWFYSSVPGFFIQSNSIMQRHCKSKVLSAQEQGTVYMNRKKTAQIPNSLNIGMLCMVKWHTS